MLYSRAEACEILGVGPFASQAEIKSAYKNLVKVYHPDTGASGDTEKYCRVVEAYEALCNSGPSEYKARIIGNTDAVKKAHAKATASRKEYASYRERAEKQKQQRKEDFEKYAAEYSANVKQKEEEERKREENYKKAMDAIQAVLVAEAIKKMIGEEK